MKQLAYSLILLTSIFGCKNKPENKVVHNQSAKDRSLAIVKRGEIKEIDPSKIECIQTAYHYDYQEGNFSPGVFNYKAFVYNSIKPGAKVIDSLSFGAEVNILKEYPGFFLVCTPKAKSGYIKKTDLYLHSVYWGLKSNIYLLGISKYPAGNDINPGACDASRLNIIKVDENKKVVDRYTDSIAGIRYKVELIHNSALKNAEAVLYLSYHCYNEMGVEKDHFVVDNGKKLSRLILGGGTGDGGYSNGEEIYLPITLVNSKKVILVKNGVIKADNTTGLLDTYPYPADSGVPIDELIVVQDKSIELDDSDEQNAGDDKFMDEKVIINSTTYYRWNGSMLKKVKTLNGK